ncbi:MAG: hypothetical protein RLZZ450_3857 [Pseudomonadota bacterium]|jgi:hypothetical protein
MKSRVLLIACVLASAVGCDDNPSNATHISNVSTGDAGADAASQPVAQTPQDAGIDAGQGFGIDAGSDAGGSVGTGTIVDGGSTLSTDASSTAVDAGSTPASDASVVNDATIVSAPDAGQDMCPPSLALHEAVTEEQVERELGPVGGGTLTSGTYYLTKRELVINPAADESAKQECRERSLATSQSTLQIEAAGPLAGSILVRSKRLDDDGKTRDYVSRNRYTIEGDLIPIVGEGFACVTHSEALPDGGVAQEVERPPTDTEDDPVWFNATDNSLTLISIWTGTSDLPSCWYVDTLEK